MSERTTTVVAIRLPKAAAQVLSDLAAKHGCTRSDVLRIGFVQSLLDLLEYQEEAS